MFDRGLLALDENLLIQVSRHVNDVESIERLIGPDRQACLPADKALWPRADFLAWHRTEVFKS
jgi:putative restriction endonuclease